MVPAARQKGVRSVIRAIVTWATGSSQDGAHGVITSARSFYPELPIYVLAAPDVEAQKLPATVVTVEEVSDGLGLAVRETLDPEEQLAFGLPFLLEQVIADAGSLIFVSPGCIVTGQLVEVDRLFADHALVFVAPVIPRDLHSTTPHLVALSRGSGLLSTRVFGIRQGAERALEDWKAVVGESFFDVFQRRPSDFLGNAFNSFAGRDFATVVGEETLMNWTDFAAVQSARAVGPNPAVVMADDLWALGRRQADEDKETEVEFQMLADKVHDSRPLAALMQLVESSIAACPKAERVDTPFDRLAREVRRSADPTGARWPPGDEQRYRDWLFETNTRGLTRIADLYVATREDLQERFPDLERNADPFRRWNAEFALAEFGMDLFDRNAEPIVPHGAPEHDFSVANALKWRLNAAKSLIPGYGRLQARRTEPYPRRRGKPVAPQRVEVVREPSLYGPSPRDLTLIGCFRSESGLGQAARASLQGLRLLGREFSIVDTTEEYVSRNATDPGLDQETFGAFGQVNLVHSNADEMITLGQRVFRHRLAGRFNAAMWFWEPSQLPRRSLPALDLVDELWVASEYLADVFGQYGKVPVKVIGLAAELPVAREARREEFGLHDGEFVFLFVYDALSSHGRKNPEKVIEAFVKAFAPAFAGVRLVLKVSNLNKFPASKAKLEALVDRNAAITLIDEYFARDRVLDLMAAADVYVSLHAAEGFGLTLLEAMSLGTPVICTGYSGNMDFTSESNSWLVAFEMMATSDQTGPYPPGSVWASPIVDSAVESMRLAAANPAAVQAKAAKAVEDAARAASLEAYAQRLDRELRRVL